MSFPSESRATVLSNGVHSVHAAFQDLARDLKATRWVRGFGWFGGIVWFLSLVGSLVVIVIGARSFFRSDGMACQADGTFRLDPRTYSMWSSSGFFQITLGGGTLTFAQAKAIDIIWDVGVGRGGQLLLAVVSWREFARYLTICMEDRPVTFQLFRTIFIAKDASISSIYRTIKSFIWQRRLRSNVAMVFMTATMVFILAFPTLASAMSGYDSNVASRVQDGENNLVPFDAYSRVLYVVHDGWRIGQDGSYWIQEVASRDEPVLRSDEYCQSVAPWSTDVPACDLVADVSQYVKTYGLGGTRNEASRYKDILLTAPVLNISAYKSEVVSLGGQSSPELLDISWVRNNQTFDLTYMRRYGKCQNTGDYQWGFSMLQLVILLVLLLAWTTGIYIMWIYTHYTIASHARHPEEVPGEYRAILELAAAMRTELDIGDASLSALREKQLRERIKKEIQGGAIFHAYPDTKLKVHSIRKSLRVWLKGNTWWFVAMAVTTLVCAGLWILMSMWLWSWLLSVWMGQLVGFCISTTTGSRLLIISIFSVGPGIALGVVAIRHSAG